MHSERVLVRSVPKPYYWIMGLLFIPLGAIVLASLLALPIKAVIGRELKPIELRWLWGVVTVVVLAAVLSHDLRHLCYTLYDHKLVLGRAMGAAEIAFSEIESIVQGLPQRMPWWLRMQRFDPHGRGVHKQIVSMRADAVLIRLSGGRYLPLILDREFLSNGPEIMARFLSLNEKKFVDADTYTEHELEGLARARFNRVFFL